MRCPEQLSYGVENNYRFIFTLELHWVAFTLIIDWVPMQAITYQDRYIEAP